MRNKTSVFMNNLMQKFLKRSPATEERQKSAAVRSLTGKEPHRPVRRAEALLVQGLVRSHPKHMHIPSSKEPFNKSCASDSFSHLVKLHVSPV